MLNSVEQQFLIKMSEDEGIHWDKPLQFDKTNIPTFPVNALPQTIKDYVVAVSESTQTSVDMSAVASLLCLAVCLQGKFIIEGNKGYTEPLCLYGVIIAPPAERKSSVMSAMTRFIYEYEQKKNAELKPQIDEYNITKSILTKQIKELEERASKPKGDYKIFRQQAIDKKNELSELEKVKPLRLIADDASPEALTSLLCENDGRMSVISAEGGIFDILAGRYTGGVNIDTFLKAHAGDALRVDRKGRESEYINSPCLSVLLAIQPQVLDGIMDNSAFRGRGLLGRFLYCYPVSRIGKRDFRGKPVPYVYETDYRALVDNLLSIPCEDKSPVIRLSECAVALLENEFNEIETRLITDLESISEWAGKYIGMILRVAGLLHIAEHLNADKTVSDITMKNAIEIGRYFLLHAQYAYSVMGADSGQSEAKYILKYISKEYHKEMTKRDIYRLCRGKFKKVEEIEPALELLIEYGYITEMEMQESTGAGRKKSPTYYINPYIYSDTV